MSSVITAGTNTTLYLAAKNQLAPYTWGKVIESDKCWVHLDVGSIEYHHIVPRTYGGEHGPQVAICGNCHTGIHGMAWKSMLFDGTIQDMVQQLNLVEQFAMDWISQRFLRSKHRELVLVRAWALSEVIYRARMLTAGDESGNKMVKFQKTLTGAESKMLKVLAKSYGVTQDQMVSVAIQELYSRRIGTLDGG